jgi:hypothetical protein
MSVMERSSTRKCSGVAFGINLRELIGDYGQISLRLALGHSGFEMAHQIPHRRKLSSPGGIRAARFLGDKDITISPAEARRHHADERARNAIEHECLVECPRIAGKIRDPGFVAQDEYRWGAGLVVFRFHDAAEQRRHPKKLEGSGCCQHTVESLCAFACVMQNFQAGVGDYAAEYVVLVDVVEEFRAGVFGAAAGLMLSGIVNLQRHHAVRIRVGKGLDEDVFHHAEDCG